MSPSPSPSVCLDLFLNGHRGNVLTPFADDQFLVAPRDLYHALVLEEEERGSPLRLSWSKWCKRWTNTGCRIFVSSAAWTMVSFISTDQPSLNHIIKAMKSFLDISVTCFLDKHYGLWGPANYLTLVLGTRETAKGQCMHAWETAMQTLVCLHPQTVDIAIPCSPSTMTRTANWLICKGSCMHSQCLHVFDTSRMWGPQSQKLLLSNKNHLFISALPLNCSPITIVKSMDHTCLGTNGSISTCFPECAKHRWRGLCRPNVTNLLCR